MRLAAGRLPVRLDNGMAHGYVGPTFVPNRPTLGSYGEADHGARHSFNFRMRRA